jgi:hypothetical protein
MSQIIAVCYSPCIWLLISLFELLLVNSKRTASVFAWQCLLEQVLLALH